MVMIAIRGATSIEYDDAKHISERVSELYQEILSHNSFINISTILFSVTPDIHSINPATILRIKYNLSNVAFMCFQEAIFANSLPYIIRILILGEGKGDKFIYLHTASKLRETLQLIENLFL